jgi:hypothetical protein
VADDETPSENVPTSEAAPERRPDPPPYRPDKDLIGYVEKGQKPPVPPQPPTEER